MSNSLTATQQLNAGQQLTSANGKARLVMQLDGNLVLYRNDTNAALWASGTNGKAVSYAIMQNDGNLVCYEASGAPDWASGTNGNSGAYLVLDDDGNLIIYNAANTAIWASNTVQWDFTPSTVAAHAILGVAAKAPAPWPYLVMPTAPGWTFKARSNGTAWADAPFGWAQVPSPGIAGRKMGTDTIIHVASMSKPVCVTALMALIEDGQAISDGVHGIGALAVTSAMSFSPVGRPAVPPQLVQVPKWLAPALSSAAFAQQLVSGGLLNLVPQALKSLVSEFASGQAYLAPSPAVPPGYAGIIAMLGAGVAVPRYNDTFLPLVKPRLLAKAASLGVAYAEGANVASVKIDQLIRHQSALRNGFTDQAPLALIPSAVTVQPRDGGHATCDIWAYLLAYLRQDADAGTGYKNDDYNVLGGIVEQCSGMTYDDYIAARLFSDPRFAALRRYVTTPNKSAAYYERMSPGWGVTNAFPSPLAFPGGDPFPDYRGWGGAGGFYFTADQITDWLYALYTEQSVQRTALGGATSAPLLSAASLSTLFGTTAYFAAGSTGNIAGWTTYTHNGGTNFGAGNCAGVYGVAVSPRGTVATAFLCANGDFDAGNSFSAALNDIITRG